jgi:uncharacterized membrane protein YdjX (TVP38/TMEM64 family)
VTFSSWQERKGKKLMKKIFVIASLLALLFISWETRQSLYAMMVWFSDRDAVASAMEQVGIWGPVTLFALFIFQVFLAFIPGQALMVACGYLYGFWGGFLLSWISLVAGGELAFGWPAVRTPLCRTLGVSTSPVSLG